MQSFSGVFTLVFRDSDLCSIVEIHLTFTESQLDYPQTFTLELQQFLRSLMFMCVSIKFIPEHLSIEVF